MDTEHNAQQILQQLYGYDSFRPQQEEIISRLINGDDALVLMPTGGGKSLCYQIPALVRSGTGIVISPLIALMQDQVDALQQLGIKAGFINSSLDHIQINEIEHQLLNGDLDLLYVAPERLLMSQMLNLLARVDIALFAIDEAHCVSQWGHDFRKEYMQLSILHEQFPQVPRIALTATADARTQQDIINNLSLHSAQVFSSSFDRPNIRYTINEAQNSRSQLWRFLSEEHPDSAGIVYCLSRKKVETVADWLNQQGRVALPYHAGLSAEQRRQHQQKFLREEGVIIVATIAFGMGIDKPDVRFVVHLNLPKSVEAYYQETGRAGRDGLPADAWMAYGLQDVITLRQMMDESTAAEQHKRVEQHKLNAMLGLCELTTCRRITLLDYFGETLAQPCGNCDNCLNPPTTWDATIAAQKALSCVYRTGQRFGVNYVIDVLLGKEDERINRFRHHTLSTYGVGKELSNTEWRSVFRQLIAMGLLNVDLERYGALYLTPAARPVLRGEQKLQLRKVEKAKAKEKKSTAKERPLRLAEQPLWEALRACRSQFAEKLEVPPYVIFSDATLRAIISQQPKTVADLARIPGVGEYKLKHYGQAFLDVVAEHPILSEQYPSLSDTVNDTLHLHQQGHDVATIAKLRELKESTVYGHLSVAIEIGALTVTDVLALSADDKKEIERAFEYSATEESDNAPVPLSTVFELLEGKWDYGILRCVRAGLHQA